MNNDMEKKAFLFKNEKYEQGSSHPAYKGNVTIDGKKWNLSFWLKQADGKGKLPQGTMFMAGEVDQWEPQQQARPQQPQPVSNDDIPF
jgi:hypothetical protein